MSVRSLSQILHDAVDHWAWRHGVQPSVLQLPDICADYAPQAIADSVASASNGLVDGAPVAEAARALFACIRHETFDLLQMLGILGYIIALGESGPLDPAQLNAALGTIIQTCDAGVMIFEDAAAQSVVIDPYDPATPTPAGYTLVCQAAPLPTAVSAAYWAAVARLEARIGKWGGASLLEGEQDLAELGSPANIAPLFTDPNRDAAAAGFATLLRDHGPESGVFNLASSGVASGQVAAAPSATAADGTVLAAAPTLQYRPFENRGLEGSLLFELSALDPAQATGGVAPAAGLPAASTLPSLLDLLIDVKYRACYDPSLAATLKASQAQEAERQALVVGATQGLQYLLSASLGPEPLSELRTVHFSLRAHRDQTLQAWTAALQQSGAAALPTVVVDPNWASLTKVDAFAPLQAGSTVYTLRINPGSTSVLKLVDLETTIELGLAELGLPLDALTRANPLDAEIVELAVAVIPTMAGASQPPSGSSSVWTGPTASITPASAIAGLLLPSQPLVAGPQRIFTRDPAAVAPLKLSRLAGTPVDTVVDLSAFLPSGGASPETSKLYDILFAVSICLPAVEVSS